MPFWHTGCPRLPRANWRMRRLALSSASSLALRCMNPYEVYYSYYSEVSPDVFFGSHEMSWMCLSMSILHRSLKKLRNSSQWQLSSEFVTKSLELCDGCWDWAPVMVQAVQNNGWKWMNGSHRLWVYFDALVFPAMCHGGIVSQLCEQPQMEEQYSAPSQWNIADGQSPRNC